jgi:hypothetical protein
VQLVITPETEFEHNCLSTFREQPLEAKLFAGSFYDCRGGWVMQKAYYPESAYRSYSDNHRDESLILTARAAKPTDISESGG